MSEKFNVLGVTDSRVDGVNYRSVFVAPLDWEDRSEPFFSRGPLSIQMDASVELIDYFKRGEVLLPGIYELETGTRRASGGKSKTIAYRVVDSKQTANAIPNAVSNSVTKPVEK